MLMPCIYIGIRRIGLHVHVCTKVCLTYNVHEGSTLSFFERGVRNKYVNVCMHLLAQVLKSWKTYSVKSSLQYNFYMYMCVHVYKIIRILLISCMYCTGATVYFTRRYSLRLYCRRKRQGLLGLDPPRISLLPVYCNQIFSGIFRLQN